MAKKRREIDRLCETMREMVRDRRYDQAYDLIADLEPEDMDSVQDLRAMAQTFENTHHYDEMKKTYLHLFNTTNVRHNLKEFIQVLIRIGEFGEAEVYLKEFEKMDGAVSDDFELRYDMAKSRGDSLDDMIALLESFKSKEYMEVWGKKLAEAYRDAGRDEDYKQEMADLHLWFGGARILPDEPEEPDEDEVQVVQETAENLKARMEAESDLENAINERVGAEVSRIVEEAVEPRVEKTTEPTLDEMLSQTAKTRIEQLDVDQVEPTGPIDMEAMMAAGAAGESVSAVHTASGKPVEEPEHVPVEVSYLNRRGQAETVGEPVKTDDPSKAKRLERMFAVDEHYEEGPADISERGIRYWTTSDVVAKLRRRDFEPPHFVLAGGEEKITLTMTKKLTKELSRLGYTSAQKVMRITAERMNSIKLGDQIDRLMGRCLLITEAAEMTRESVDQLLAVMHEFGEDFVVVLAGPFDEIDCFLDIYPELAEQLGYKVRMVY